MNLVCLVYIYNIYNINGCQWPKNIFNASGAIKAATVLSGLGGWHRCLVVWVIFVLFGNANGEVIAVSYVCAVCNGMEGWTPLCPACGEAAEDRGRLSDYYDPYSPYRPIDDLKMTNGYNDLERHQCIHSIFCEQCGQSFAQAVQELALE